MLTSQSVRTMQPAPDSPLANFIEENHKLLSVLGVFTALTVFARAVPIRLLGDILSFLFLGATIVLWFELQERFPSKTTSQKLRLFEFFVGSAVLVLVACWLFVYWAFWRQILVGVLFLVLSLVVAALLQKYDTFNRLFRTRAGHRKGLRHAFYFATVAALLVATFLIADLAGVKLIPLLESLRSSLQTPP